MCPVESNNKKHRSLGPHPNPQNPPSQVSATLPHYVGPNSLLRISKPELATELKSTRIKITLAERKLEKQNSDNASIKKVKDRYE